MLAIALTCALQIVINPGQSTRLPYAQYCINPSYGEHTIQVASTGKSETYSIWGPQGFPQGPLLVLFHSFQKDHLEWQKPIWDGYDIITEAVDRGWYVVMHDGGESTCISDPPSFTTYGDDSFQDHTEAVIKNVICRFNIDKNRIYGYGFSMGGEEVLAYAARHRNPISDEGFFAGVVNHSGYYSPIYQVSGSQQVPAMCGALPSCLYGNQSYCQDPFRWRRATVLDLEVPCPGNYASNWPPLPTDVEFYNSQIHNLARTPIKTYYATPEDNCQISMNDLLASWLATYYGVQNLIQPFNCGPVTCDSIDPDCTPNAHMWDAVCADDALDFLEAHTRDSVMTDVYGGQGIILCAEDNKRFYDFKVKRIDPDDFGRIHWFKPSSSQSIGFLALNPTLGTGTPNISELTILANSQYLTFLDTSLEIEIHSNYPTTMKVKGYATQPSDVILDGSGSQPFTYNANSKIVTFTTGSSPTTEVWRIVP